jgi:cytochrome c biogenesis protein CcmG/thiol:disulfide interchange protein DsbE
MNRLLVWAPLVVLALLAALFVGWSLKRDPQIKPDAMVGQTIPEVVLPLLTGEGELDLKTAAVGRPMIVNLFASWCAPCRIEHPQLMALEAQGIRVVGVAYKDEPGNTRAFLAELGDPFALVLVDREGRAGIELGVSGVPETFAVDAYGRIVAKHAGPIMDEVDLNRLVAALRAPAPTPDTH